LTRCRRREIILVNHHRRRIASTKGAGSDRFDALDYEPRITRFGKYVYVQLCDKIDIDCNRVVHSMDYLLRKKRFKWLLEGVPAYGTLALIVDFEKTSMHEVREYVFGAFNSAMLQGQKGFRSRVVTLGVKYGGEYGPDIEMVAKETGLTIKQVVKMHTSRIYHCYMLGFSPGFVYLGELDPRLWVKRLDTPRTKVPAGSVGLAGSQTGFYGISSPGGWRIIGRLAERSFDVRLKEPSKVRPGDDVKFVEIR